MSRTFAAFRIRNYRIFALGSFVSNVGTWMQRMAQDWLVLELAGGGRALGITTGLQFLPTLLLSPIAGVVADRFPRRRLLVVSQSTMGLAAGLLGVLTILDRATTAHVYVIAFIFGVGSAFDVPARQAFVGEMVDLDHLPNAIGLNSASINVARMIGPAAAGILIAALGSDAYATGWVILINALSYLAVIGSLAVIRVSELITIQSATSARGLLRAGIIYVIRAPDIVLVLAVVFCVGTFGLNFQISTVLMATEVFGKGAGEFGILGSLLAVGSLAGSLLAARRRRIRPRDVVVAAAVFGVTEIALGMMPSYGTFAVFLPLCGVAAFSTITAASSLVQMSTAAEMRGRVMAIYMMIFLGGTPLGAPLAGWVAERWGARWTLLGGGALTTLGTLLAAVALGGRGSSSARRPGFRSDSNSAPSVVGAPVPFGS